MEQRSRAECIPECKSKCATTKEQLMKGTPIAKEQKQEQMSIVWNWV